ncbi:MAG: hypothetical protein AAF799_03230 [Myxococcota bacterium]
MRTPPVVALDAEAHRGYRGPTAIRDEPGRAATWVDPRPPREPEPEPEPEVTDEAEASPEPQTGEGVTPPPPSPSSVREAPEHITLAVGLAPEAPGSRAEKALLAALETHATASANPTTAVRHLRPGAGTPRQICRDRQDDFVVMIGYVADREEPVVLAHDCRLDHALGIRSAAATSEPGLVATLWREHLELQRSGIAERRTLAPLGRKARGGIIAGVAIVVVGVAVGALVANALREETVVITVRP